MTDTFTPLIVLGGLNYGVQKTLTLQPDEAAGLDTYIYGFGAGNNYGISGQLQVGLGVAAAKYRSLLAFDVSSIPATSKIDSAVLTLYCEFISGVSIGIGAHLAITQWYEGAKNGAAPDGGQDGSTYNLRNNNGAVPWAGGAGGAAGADWTAVATDSTTVGAVGYYTWQVHTAVRLWIAGANNYGWWLVSANEGVASRRQFSSSSGATASQRPKLEVVYRELIP